MNCELFSSLAELCWFCCYLKCFRCSQQSVWWADGLVSREAAICLFQKQGQCQAHWGPHSWLRLECKFYICVNPKWTYFVELMSFSKESQRFRNMFPQTTILHWYSIFRVLHINILANKIKIPECTFSAQRYNLHLNNKNYRNIQKRKSFISLPSECWATIIPRKM